MRRRILQGTLAAGALTLADGRVLGFTDHDRALTVDGTACKPASGFTATEARDTLGLANDTVDVEGALSSDMILEDAR